MGTEIIDDQNVIELLNMFDDLGTYDALTC